MSVPVTHRRAEKALSLPSTGGRRAHGSERRPGWRRDPLRLVARARAAAKYAFVGAA